MSEARTRFVFLACLAVLTVAAFDACWLGWSDLPLPAGVDDAFYKSPAAELVQRGRLAQPSVIGYLPRADEVFAAYPPLYQLAVAGWFGLFGITATASASFGHAIHLADMAAMMALVVAVLSSEDLPAGWRAFVAAAVGILFFGVLRFFDRQEEFAGFWCLLEMILYARGVRSGVLSGALLGACAMISPWTAIVFAMILGMRGLVEVLRRKDEGLFPALARQLGRLAVIGLVAALPVVGWLVWLERAHPGIVTEQFLYHIRVSERTTIFDAPDRVIGTLLRSPYQLPALLLTLVYFPRLLFGPARASLPTTILALFLGAGLSLIVVLVYRVNSYNYVWICLILLMPCFGVVAAWLVKEATPRERFLPALVVLLCVAASLRDPISLSLIAHDLPESERPAAIHARLARQIPPGDLVATNSRYWYFFQNENRNPWRLTAIWPHLTREERHAWQWIVLPLNDRPTEERARLLEGFELVEAVPSEYTTFYPSFTLEDRTWAYELYRRRAD